MKALIRITNLTSSIAVLKKLIEVINSDASLQKQIIKNGVLFAELSPEEVKNLSEQLIKHKYLAYQMVKDSVRLNAEGGSTDGLIKILLRVLAQETGLAKMLWTKGLTLETATVDQANELKKSLEEDEGVEVIIVATSQFQFEVSGQVIRSDNTQLSGDGYTLQAFDQVGNNNTVSLGAPVALQADGSYQISYTWESPDGRNGPNLFVRLYDRNGKAVAENNMPNAGRQETLNLLVELPVPFPPPTDPSPIPKNEPFIVHGTIRLANGSTLPGIMVRAFDRDMRSEEALGEVVPDTQGFYEISYTRDQFQRAEKESADLLVKVFDKANQELAANEIIFNASHLEIVNFVLEDEQSKNQTECERYNQELQPLLEKVTLQELTHADIYFLHKETGISLLHLKFLQLDDEYRQSFKVGNCLFYGLFRQGLPVNLERLIALDPEKIREAFKKSIEDNIISSKLEDDLEQLLKAFQKRNLPDKEDVQAFGNVAHLSPVVIKKKHPEMYERLVQIALTDIKDNLESYFKDSSDDFRYYIYTLDFSKNKGSESIKDFLRHDIQQHKVSQSAVQEGLSKIKDWDGPETLDAVLLPTIPINQNPLFEPYLQQADIFKITGLASLSDAVAQQLAVRNISLYNIGPETIKGLVDEKVISEKQGQSLQLNANVFALANGDTLLATAIKNSKTNVQLNSIADLVSLEEDDWKAIFKSAKVAGDKEEIEKKIKVKQKQIEILYPHEVFKVKSAASEAPKVRDLMQKFYTANDQLNFLRLNYDFGSDDIQKINVGNFSEAEQKTIVNNLKTNKRLYSITKDAKETFQLKNAGFDSSLEILSSDNKTFARNIGVSATRGNEILESAKAKVGNLSIAASNALDAVTNPGNGIMGGIGFEPQSYLRRLNGYEEFFGETDFCKCSHCSSIISPVAYYVDLMEFLKVSVMRKYFPEPDFKTHHLLSPGKRRYDLWNGLKLTCQNTHELVPYLTIIIEVLENFIFTPERDIPITAIPDRLTIENFVYTLLSKRDGHAINSFSQPFHLPLSELEIYLQHFPITQASIAQTILAYVVDGNHILAQAQLNISAEEYKLIKDVRAEDEDQVFLANLYQITGDYRIINLQELLQVMEIERSEFTDLIKTYFVTFISNDLEPRFENIKIVGGRTEGNLQINKEEVQNLTLGVLDRMHRFIRLWKQLNWSINELDKVIECLHKSYVGTEVVLYNLLPDQIVKLNQLQKTLKIDLNDLVSFICDMPFELIDKRFNLDAFIQQENDEWTKDILDEGALKFQHPGYRDEASVTDTSNLLHRLLAGLGINDEELFLLIDNLRDFLDMDEPTHTIIINAGHLSILYCHSLLLKKYKLTVAELFFLIRITPSIIEKRITGLSDVLAFIDTVTWQRESNYSVAELEIILVEELGEVELTEDPAKMAYSVWSQIQNEQSLLFADTIFSYAEGISEEQSRRIIAANKTILIPADLKKYSVENLSSLPFVIHDDIKAHLSLEQQTTVVSTLIKTIAKHLFSTTENIAATVLEDIKGIRTGESQRILTENPTIFHQLSTDGTDYQLNPEVAISPMTIGITIPDTIWTTLAPNDQQELYLNLLRYMQLGTPEFTDRLWVGIAGLTLEQSREIITANNDIFREIESDKLYWLSAAFDPSALVEVPVNIPLPAVRAQELLMTKHVGEVIPNLLSGQLGFSSEKLKALAIMGGYDFNDDAFSASLTGMAQGTESLAIFEQLIGLLQRMSVWFKDRNFDSGTLAFIAGHSGDERQLFKINAPDDFRSPALAHLQQTEDYRWLRKKLPGDAEAVESLHEVLASYGSVATLPKFADTDTALENLAVLLNAEESLIGAINNLSIYEGVGLFPATDADGNTSNEGLKALRKFKDVVDLIQYLGIGAEVLPLFISNEFEDLASAVQAVVAAIRTKYDSEEEWEKKIGPFQDKIREKKRDALTDYLKHTFRSTLTTDKHWFRTTHDLYNYFLIDTELEGCARTSRVVAGISSLQLYIQRCLMNLEQSEDGSIHVEPTDIPAGEWEWRKNYRVWEANRKVFLYPENYIEPDLRDNKTELFTELESTLLQQEISSQNALDAYSKYMKGFDEIATLKIAGSYHHLGDMDNTIGLDVEADTLHLFAVTSSEPPIYYYRTIKNIYKKEKNPSKYGILYNPWVKLNLQIPVKKVSPIIYNSKLYVFWAEITTRPKNDMVDGTNQFVGYEHKMSVKFSSLQLDGTWQAPQQLKLIDPIFDRGDGVVWDPLLKQIELTNWLIPYELNNKFKYEKLSEIKEELRKNVEILNDRSHRIGRGRFADLTNSKFRTLLKPKYEQPGYDIKQLHLEPKDGYTLIGEKWERIFPEIENHKLILEGTIFETAVELDIYNLRAFPTSRPPYRNNRFLPENKRLLKRPGLEFLDVGYPGVEYISGYGNAFKFLFDSLLTSSFTRNLLGGSTNNPLVIDIVNGTLTDATLNVNGDLLYLHSIKGVNKGYAIERLNTTLSELMNQRLFEKGMHGLLDIKYQKRYIKEIATTLYIDTNQVRLDLHKNHLGQMDTTGSLGTYFREIFFHTPFLIANHLNSQNKFADAQRWYHFIFNPTANLMPDELAAVRTTEDPIERRKMTAKRVWQFIEFRNHTLATWRAQLNDQQAIEAYKKDPFNPHAIARLRLGAYMKSITMKYIDNLIDWGDHLFAQDTMESINEATLLYIMASEILGERPAELGECEQDTEDQTYEGLIEKMQSKKCADFLNEIESITDPVIRRNFGVDYETVKGPSIAETYFAENKAFSLFKETSVNGSFTTVPDDDVYIKALGERTASTHGSDSESQDVRNHLVTQFKIDLVSFHTSFLKQACLFCIPPNPDLLAYWDRAEDRLYKIRNCMNISGVKRQLALFAPEIDPRLLVRAKAAGLSLDDVLNSINGDLPPYRFAFLLAKAKEYAGALQGFGGALLGALEKKSGEELALLRMRQQDEVLKVYTSKLRDMEVAAAEAGLEGLLKRQQSIHDRVEYYDNLIDEGLIAWEHLQSVQKQVGNVIMATVGVYKALAGGFHLLPKILGLANSTGGDEVAESTKSMGDSLQNIAQIHQLASESAGIQASYKRREQGWKFSRQQTENELKEIEPSLVAAEIRRDISIKSRELHEKNIEQHQETFEFYRDKFTNHGLYTYLSTQLQRMYRESYQNTMSLARMAERAYRFERNDDTSVLLGSNYWDASRAGLMAGEKLMNDLRKMEMRYMETNTRSMEVDQAFSLTQIDPAALINLKATGTCEFTVPELYFDLFYPGQYRRQIKSARLTIPCITGPYSNVSAVMTLKSSYIRKDPKLDDGNSALTLIPPSRSTAVATSTAQNDSGVYKLDFRDERYMPFEGAGAVESTWQIELPKSLRPFDYSTINDIILHISYTAEYSTQLRAEVETGANNIESMISSEGFSLPRIFSLRQEFSQGYHQLLHSARETPVSLGLGEKHFPMFLQGKELEIISAELLIEVDENGFINEDGTVVIPPAFTFELGIRGNVSELQTLNTWSRRLDENNKATNIFSASIPVPTVFNPFLPVSQALDIQLTISDAGVLAPNNPPPSDPSALDDHKIKDIYLLLDYRVATPTPA